MRADEEELALVARFAATGDRGAFEEIARRQLPAARRFLATRLRGRDELEEAEADFLLRLYRGLASWRGESSLRTWVFRLCSLSAADLVRRRVRQRAKERRLGLAGEGASRESDRADWELERSSEAETLRRCLSELGEPTSSLVYLRDAEGLAVDELAVIFCLPAGTVKSRLSRGRDRLKALLLREGLGGGNG